MKVTIDGQEHQCSSALISEGHVHLLYEPGPTRVPPKSDMVRWATSVEVLRD